MRDTFSRIQPYAPVVIRIGISLVYLWFGTSQIINPSVWTLYVPDYATKLVPLPLETLVLGNGVAEVILSLLLIIGFKTRIAAGLLSLHALHLLTVVGYTAIGVRDFGIAMGAVSIFIYGSDLFSLDDWRSRKSREKIMTMTANQVSQ